MQSIRFQRLLRLQEGDSGYSHWMIAKHALLEEIEYAIHEIWGIGDMDELGNRALDDPVEIRWLEVMGSFPLELTEI
jgi:hypothetical protein